MLSLVIHGNMKDWRRIEEHLLPTLTVYINFFCNDRYLEFEFKPLMNRERNHLIIFVHIIF